MGYVERPMLKRPIWMSDLSGLHWMNHVEHITMNGSCWMDNVELIMLNKEPCWINYVEWTILPINKSWALNRLIVVHLVPQVQWWYIYTLYTSVPWQLINLNMTINHCQRDSWSNSTWQLTTTTWQLINFNMTVDHCQHDS